MSKVAVLGTGTVGITLANGFQKYGYDVALGSRDGKQPEGWSGAVGTFQEVARTAEIVVLSVRGEAAEQLVQNLTSELAGKIVIDTTNPIDTTKPPVNGVLHFFTSLSDSLLERLQKIAPEAKFVKAFNSVGSGYMVNPTFETTPTMFICGNDEAAKKTVGGIIAQFGWEPMDMGSTQAARAIEPLCMLWCIPGLKDNDWGPRAFKMLKK